MEEKWAAVETALETALDVLARDGWPHRRSYVRVPGYSRGHGRREIKDSPQFERLARNLRSIP